MSNQKDIIGLRTTVVIEGFYDESGRVICTILDPDMQSEARRQGKEYIFSKMRSKLGNL